MYVCVYVYTHIHIQYVYIYILTHTEIYTYIHTYMFRYICISLLVQPQLGRACTGARRRIAKQRQKNIMIPQLVFKSRTHMCIYVYVYIYICMYIFIYIHIYVHTHTIVNFCVYNKQINKYIYICIHTYIHMQAGTGHKNSLRKSPQSCSDVRDHRRVHGRKQGGGQSPHDLKGLSQTFGAMT